MSIPTTEPVEIVVGATQKWRKQFTNYPASAGWSLAYFFRGVGAGIDVEGDLVVPDGDAFVVTIPAYAAEDEPATSLLSAGRYDWQAWVSNDAGEEYLAADGQVTVKANLLNADSETAFDGRSEAELSLAAVRVALDKAVAKNAQEYQIAGRLKREHSLSELVTLEEHLVMRVNAERRAKRGSFFRNVHVRFTEPR